MVERPLLSEGQMAARNRPDAEGQVGAPGVELAGVCSQLIKLGAQGAEHLAGQFAPLREGHPCQCLIVRRDHPLRRCQAVLGREDEPTRAGPLHPAAPPGEQGAGIEVLGGGWSSARGLHATGKRDALLLEAPSCPIRE